MTMQVPSETPLLIQNLTIPPQKSPWSGGFHVTTVNGEPVIEYLKRSQLSFCQFWQWLFSAGEFSSKRVIEVLRNDKTFDTLVNELAAQQKQEAYTHILANITAIEKNAGFKKNETPLSQKITEAVNQILEKRKKTEAQPPKDLSTDHTLRPTLPSPQEKQRVEHAATPVLSQQPTPPRKPVFAFLTTAQVEQHVQRMKTEVDRSERSDKEHIKKILNFLASGLSSTAPDSMISAPQAYQALARLRYLMGIEDVNSVNIEKGNVLESLRDHVCNQFKKIREPQPLPPFSEQTLENVSLSQRLAEVLVLPDGTINDGLIDDVKHNLIHKKDHRSVFEENAIFALRQIQNDASLRKKIESLPQPSAGSPGERMMRVSLQKPEQSLSKRDLTLACLSASISSWRQTSLGSCYATSFMMQLKDASLHFFVDDLTELVKTGSLLRKVQGASYQYYGLDRLTFGPSIEKFSAKQLDQVANLPGVKNALSVLGVPASRQQKRLKAATSTSNTWTIQEALKRIDDANRKKLDEVLEALQGTIPKPHKSFSADTEQIEILAKQETVKKICAKLGHSDAQKALTEAVSATSQKGTWTLSRAIAFMRAQHEQKMNERFRLAVNYVDAMAEPPLLRWHENAVASMMMNPLTTKTGGTFQQKSLRACLVMTCIKMMDGFQMGSIMDLAHKATKSYFQQEMALQTDQGMDITTIVKYNEKLNSLPGDYLKIFDRMRCCFSPPSSSSENGVWVFCEEQNGAVVPLNEATMAKLLKKMTLGIATSVSNLDPAAQDTLRGFLNSLEDTICNNKFKEAYEYNITKSFQSPKLLAGEWTQGVLATRGQVAGYVASSIDIEEVYGNATKKETNVNLDRGQESVIEVGALCQTIAQAVSEDPRLTARAYVKSHAFRLLPNSPTLQYCNRPALKKMEQELHELIQQPLNAQNELLVSLQRFAGSLSAQQQSAVKNILSNPNQTIEACVKSIKENLHKEGGTKATEQEQNLENTLLRKLVSGNSKIRQLIHFADTNWVAPSPNKQLKQQSIHYCFWYNPFAKQWNVVTAPEDEKYSLYYRIESDKEICVRSVPADISQAILDRSLLHRPRQLSKALVNIEESFVEAYKALGNNQVSEFRDPLPGTLLQLLRMAKETIKGTYSPAERCGKLQALYGAIKKKHIELQTKKTSHGTIVPIGYRVTRIGPDAKILHELDAEGYPTVNEEEKT